jgi:hypothetical protein
LKQEGPEVLGELLSRKRRGLGHENILAVERSVRATSQRVIVVIGEVWEPGHVNAISRSTRHESPAAGCVAGRTELVLRAASLSQIEESLPRLSAGGERFARLTVDGKLELHNPPNVSVLADESDWR